MDPHQFVFSPGLPQRLVLIAIFIVASAVLGWIITAAVLRIARVRRPLREPDKVPVIEAKVPPVEVMRGGALIGVLERILITGVVMLGQLSLVAVVLAIKGLGRYPELKSTPEASERFIIGTLTSVAVALLAGYLGHVALLYISW